ncbi:MAG TPA: RNA polymerase sigma factor [Minicystis sp.]|nr:RNA polymerase sigma factor [Minicystis sp.]
MTLTPLAHAAAPGSRPRARAASGTRLSVVAASEPPESGLRAKVVARPLLALVDGPEPAVARGEERVAVAEPLEIDELVRRAQRGDRQAFAELFRRHRADVGRLVYRMLGPTADAEDVVQEVFLQVHRSLGEFRGEAKFSTWLHRVSVNVVLMVRRAARSRPVFAGEAREDLEPARGLLPDEDAARRARITAFRRLLDRLPEKKRTVFELHELEGMAPADISTLVGAPVLTVRTRLFYARRELAAMMRDEPALAQLAAELAAADETTTKEDAETGGGAERAGGAARAPRREAT